MARVTGDLWPQASGSASLGVEQSGANSFGTEIRPYAHIHQNSGIFHNPTRGSSGVIRFQNSSDVTLGPQQDFFGFSFDGGANYPLEIGGALNGQSLGAHIDVPFGGLLVIASGNTSITSLFGAATLAAFGIASDVNIQTLNGGININAAGGSIFNLTDVNFIVNATNRAEIRTFNDRVDITSDSNDVNISAGIDARIASVVDINEVAGAQLAMSAFGSGNMDYRFGPHQSWYIKTSHSNTGGPFNDGYWPIAHSGNVEQLIANATNGFITQAIEEITVGGSTVNNNSVEFTYSGNGIFVSAVDPSTIDFYSEIRGVNGTSISSPTDGLVVINSAALSGLQNQYQAGRVLRTSFDYGDLDIIAAGAKTVFSTAGSLAPLNVSGIFTPPSSGLAIGDMYMMSHSVIGGVVDVRDAETASAKSLGVGTLVINTGSGQINVMTGSGIAEFLTVSVMDITTADQVVPFTTPFIASDANYSVGSEAAGTSGIITIFSPGLYKVDLKVQATKIVGSTPQGCRVRAYLNNTAILGTIMNTFHFDSTTASTQSCSMSFLINADADAKLEFRINSTLSGADNCRLVTRAGLMVIQKIGPKRGVF